MNGVFRPGQKYIRPFPASPLSSPYWGRSVESWARQWASGFTSELTKAPLPSELLRVTGTGNKSPSCQAACVGSYRAMGPLGSEAGALGTEPKSANRKRQPLHQPELWRRQSGTAEAWKSLPCALTGYGWVLMAKTMTPYTEDPTLRV